MELRPPLRLAAALGAVIAAGLTSCSTTSTATAPAVSTVGATIPLLRVGLGSDVSTLDEAKINLGKDKRNVWVQAPGEERPRGRSGSVARPGGRIAGRLQ